MPPTRYETILDTWEKIADIQEARHSAFGTAAAADEKVFIAGGYPASMGLECMSQTCEMYNVRGVATCTHVRTCVPEKKGRNETKQQKYKTDGK